MTSSGIPGATVNRLPIYLRVLVDLADQGRSTIASEALAELSGVNASKVRKDLSHLGTYGTRGVGYEVPFLVAEISRELGLTEDWPVAIVGFGNLGHALVNYKGFEDRGFHVVAVFDADKTKVGQKVGKLVVQDVNALKKVAGTQAISIVILATPAAVAQQVADKVVAAGIKSILNFAPAIINVPDDVSVRKVDLSMELQILSFYQQRTRS
ncbi:MAG: redox-sensing transcriptional repressor Rex [Actinomycetota bacterium]